MNLQLRDMRKSRHMTQSELAEKIGATLRQVSSWERYESHLPFDEACAIADVFGCTLDELAGRWEYVETPAATNPDEQAVVDAYRSANPQGRAAIEAVAASQGVSPTADELPAPVGGALRAG